MGQELWQKEEEHEQCQEYDEIFFWLDHFAERYLDKLDDVQCHRNVTELETHIEYIQERYKMTSAQKAERVQKIIDVPKRQHYEKHEVYERQDHNTDTLFEFCHNQGNNRVQIEAQVCCVHEAEEEQNKQIQKIKSGDSQEVTQRDAYTESDYG